MNPVTADIATGKSNRRDVLIDLGLLALVLMAAYAPIIFTGRFFQVTHLFSDWLALSQPAYTYTGQALARGEFPLWNPHWFAGYPHFAVPSNSVLYPTTLLFGFMDFASAAKILIFTHLYFCGATSYLLGRRICASRWAALFLGLCGIGGNAVIWPTFAGNLWTLTTLAWFPLCLIFLLGHLDSGKIAPLLGLAAAGAAMCLAGDPAVGAFSFFTIGVFTLVATLVLPWNAQPRATLLVRGLSVLAALGFAMLLAAVQLLPSQEFVGQSVRRLGVTYQYWAGYIEVKLAHSFEYSAFETQSPATFIAGKVTFALAFVSLFGKIGRKAAILWTLFLGFCLLNNVSESTYESFLRYIPIINGVRGIPYSHLTLYLGYLMTSLGLVALVEATDHPTPRKLPWLVAVGLALVSLIVSAYHDPRPSVNIASVAALVVLAVFVFRFQRARRYVGPALCSLIVMEMIPVFLFSQNYGGTDALKIQPALALFSAARTDTDRLLILDPVPGRIPQGPAVTLLTGDRNLEGYHALFLDRYATLLRDVAGVPIAKIAPDGRLDAQGDYGHDWITPAALPVLDLLNVRYILRNGAPSAYPKAEASKKSPRFSFRIQDGLRIFENHDALPPMFPVHDVAVVKNNAEAVALLRSGFDCARRAILSGDAALPALAPATAPEPVTLTQYGPNAMEAKVSMTAPGLLVLSEAWYPGWYAQVDGGALQPTLCADIAIQATPVPAGDHTVRFVFRPHSLIIGAMISAIAFAIWSVALAILVVRKKQSQHALG